jgi:CHAD domain-containing protein
MAKARPIPGFADAGSFGAAAAMAVEVRAEEVFEHREGVLDMREIERVHDMRVATRRLRAALEIFAVCFPKKPHRRLLEEVKALADALGERRDRDVAIAALEEAASTLTATERPGIRRLTEDLRAEQAAANEALARKLDEIDADDLRRRLLALAADARDRRTEAAA